MTTYYLNNLSDGGDGTTADLAGVNAAFKTIAACQAVLDALGDNGSGDTVIVYEGDGTTYGDYYEAGITRIDWLIYQAYNDPSNDNPSSANPIFTIIDISNQGGFQDAYIKFNGFTISPENDDTSALAVRYSNFVFFENLAVIGAGPTNTTYGCRIWEYSNNVTVNNCNFSGGENTGRFEGFNNIIYVRDEESTYIIISNNTLQQCWHYAVYIACGAGNAITNNEMTLIGGDGIYFRSGVSPSADELLIEYNEIHDIAIYVPTLSETSTDTTWSVDGLTMTNAAATWEVGEPFPWVGNIEIVVVSGNNVNVGDFEVQVDTVTSSTEIIFNKTISSGGQPSNVDYYLRSVTHGDLIQAGAATGANFYNITIRGNLLYDLTEPAWAYIHFEPRNYAAPAPLEIGAREVLIENNVCWNNNDDGGEEYDHPLTLRHTDGLVFRNNIVLGRVAPTRNENFEMVGNIIGYIQVLDDAGLTDNDYNIMNRGTFEAPFSAGANSTFINPGTAEANWDDPVWTGIFTTFPSVLTHASANSTGINHGDPNNYPLIDINQNVRGSSPDAGAYEYYAENPNPSVENPSVEIIAVYSRNDETVLPSNDTNLSNEFTSQEYTDVASLDDIRVSQTSSGYSVFLFKDKNNSQETVSVTCTGQSDYATSDSTVYLQIYNRNSTTWETLDTDNTTAVNTNFTLTGEQIINLSNYYDTNFWISCRVYQQAT